MKQLLRNFLRRFGVDLVRYIPQPAQGIDVLPAVIAERVGRQLPCYIVQVGANDGVRHDPIRESILRFDLPGLLIEPLPDVFRKLCEGYAGRARLAFENCAVGAADGEATLYRFSPDAPLPDFAHELASFRREHLLRSAFQLADAERYVQSISVPVRTFDTLLAKHGRPTVDLLQVDTEGFDYEVVRLALAAGLRPAVVHYENAHLSPRERGACATLLVEAGYGYVDIGENTLALRANEPNRSPSST